jgi:hypothetical protein
VSEDVLDPAGRKRVRALRKALCREYAQTVGRGACGVGASLLLKLVAVATELHEQALRAGDVETVRKQAETIRTTLAYAREDCARVGDARAAAKPANTHAEFYAALERAEAAEKGPTS